MNRSRERERESSQGSEVQTGQNGRRVGERQLGFIERGTGKHQSNTVYSTEMARTLVSGEWKSSMKIIDD